MTVLDTPSSSTGIRPTLRQQATDDPTLDRALTLNHNGGLALLFGICTASGTMVAALILGVAALVCGLGFLGWITVATVATGLAMAGWLARRGVTHRRAARALIAHASPRHREALATDIHTTYGLTLPALDLPLLPDQRATLLTEREGKQIEVTVLFLDHDTPVTVHTH